MSEILRIHYDICDSTNTRAKEYLKENPVNRAVFTADAQWGGRGRQGKSFYSPAKTGVYLTYAFKGDLPPHCAVSVTTAAAAQVCRALEEISGKKLAIKWVNDIYLGDRKICGILTENIYNMVTNLAEYVIIGVGVNLCTDDFPGDISHIAGNLGGIDREKVISALISALGKTADAPDDRGFMDYYRKKSMVIGKYVFCITPGGREKVFVTGIDDDGGLVVRQGDGSVKTLRSGEISLRFDV